MTSEYRRGLEDAAALCARYAMDMMLPAPKLSSSEKQRLGHMHAAFLCATSAIRELAKAVDKPL